MPPTPFPGSRNSAARSTRSSASRSPSPSSWWRCSSRCSRSNASGLYGVLKAIGAGSRHAVPRRRGPGRDRHRRRLRCWRERSALLLDAVIPAGAIPFTIGATPARRQHRVCCWSPSASAARSRSAGCSRIDPATRHRRFAVSTATLRRPPSTSPSGWSAVRKVYGVADTEVVALDHATLTVANDEIVALVGPSGSGKTTLCTIAGGILSADRRDGSCVGGHDISELLARSSSPSSAARRSASCSRA